MKRWWNNPSAGGFIATMMIVMCFIKGVCSLRNVAANIPVAVTPGDTVTLQCQYDLEGESLYTVKWYKGRKEFFRYIPKELPHSRVFPLSGVLVDVGRSGPHQVVLRDVQLSMAGRYKCEVSADAPSFNTRIVDSYMHVVLLPEGPPHITSDKQRYSVGDTLRTNCSAPAASPAVNLTWFINDKPIIETVTIRSPVPEPPSLNSSEFGSLSKRNFHTVFTGLDIVLGVQHFKNGKVRIRCEASVFHVYRDQVEMLILEDDNNSPRPALVLATRAASNRFSSNTAVFLLTVVQIAYHLCR